MKQKKIQVKLPRAPKKALSSFLLYRDQIYQSVKRQNPDAAITQISTIISELWNRQSPQTKRRLQVEHEKNKKVAELQKEFYQRKYGQILKRKKIKRKKLNQVIPKFMMIP